MTNKILFYGETEPYFIFSNFYVVTITIDGKEWPSTEHYYQALKSHDEAWIEKVRAAPTCMACKILGRAAPDYDSERWDALKDDVMRVALRAKFTQHDYLRVALLATGDATLVEDSPEDDYWGQVDGVGKNRLGVLLMELRAELAG